MNKIDIVLAADKNIDIGLVVALYSALKNINPAYLLNIFILDNKITKNTKNKLKKSLDKLNKKYEITYIEFPENLIDGLKGGEEIPYWNHINNFAYARLLIPNLLPSSIKFCVYLDCDIIVNRDLSEIEQFFTNTKYPICVAHDPTEEYLSSGMKKEYAKRNLEINIKHFNSGVMIFNLELWRNQDLSKKTLTLAYALQAVNTCLDQGVLNMFFHNNWFELDSTWNLISFDRPYVFEKVNQNKNAILHAAGPYKPWHYFYDFKRNELFYDVLKETEFKNWKHPSKKLLRCIKEKIINTGRKNRIINSLLLSLKNAMQK